MSNDNIIPFPTKYEDITVIHATYDGSDVVTDLIGNRENLLALFRIIARKLASMEDKGGA